MSGQTPGQAARDLQAEQDRAAWLGWMEAKTYSTHPDDCDGMEEAFAAGMRAERRRCAQEQPAPELAAAMRESSQLRDYLDDFTRAVIDLDAGRGGNFAKAAHSVRKKTGLVPVEGK